MTEPHDRSNGSQARQDHERTGSVEWRHGAAADFDPPVVTRIPYLEVTLEYPGLEATRFDDAFFPDAVPYRSGDEHRVFYWQSGIRAESSPSAEWRGVCATTHELAPVGSDGATPTLTSATDVGLEVVVDGTVAGGSTATVLADYSPPPVRVSTVSPDAAEVTTPAGTVGATPGDRRQVSLPEATARAVEPETRTVTVAPELTVRFPGVRTLYHPAIGADYSLFPSFGLDLEVVPNPLPVPTANGDLDHDRLEDTLIEDQSVRPYAESVLWQAFCYTAFDPHRKTPSKLAQFDDGTIAVDPRARVVSQ